MIEISNIVNLIIGNNRLIVGMFMIIIEIFFYSMGYFLDIIILFEFIDLYFKI